ncbi:hypothetical protein LIER_17845 [Lithospermum erythrorhizon]|uniref:Uncharacterized protein n=1 Tax=Lithospermum erythrorhizon TaxID=34254 RepID=A0AAV3QEA4_LITER
MISVIIVISLDTGSQSATPSYVANGTVKNKKNDNNVALVDQESDLIVKTIGGSYFVTFIEQNLTTFKVR